MKSKHQFKESITRNNYPVVNCKTCGYWHVHPMPTEEELNRYYETRYYEANQHNRTQTDRLHDPDGFYTIQYQDTLRYLNRVMPKKYPRTILDIGAGYGDFLRFMHRHGWTTGGIEPSKHAIELIDDRKKLNIRQANINNLSGAGFGRQAVVALNNVLEHLPDPVGTINAVRKHLLMPKGILLIVIPNEFNVMQQLINKVLLQSNPQKQHYWLMPPEHLNYWTMETLRKFLNRCGYNVLYGTVDFPMELFPLMGEDYISSPEKGRPSHLKRVRFEKCIEEGKMQDFKDRLFEAFANLGVGRTLQVFATPKAAK